MNSPDSGGANMPNEEITEIIRGELPYLTEHFGVKRIGLFGSFARGTPRNDSDVDILVEFDRPIGLKFMEFADYLEQVLDRKVDILTPAGVQSVRVRRIAQEIEEGVVYV
jgi:predicted nucleotidyltransferase